MLTPSDHEALTARLPYLYKLRDVAELAPVMLEISNEVVPSHYSCYNELNMRTGALIAAYEPSHFGALIEPLLPELAATVGTHPVYHHHLMTGEGNPQLTSDRCTEAEMEENPFHIVGRPMGVKDSLFFWLHDVSHHWIFILINRAQRDFTERDRAMAGLLRTHFSAAYANALAYTESQAKALLFDRMIDSAPQAVILLDSENRIVHLTASAADRLHEYFPDGLAFKAALPRPIDEWLKEQRVTSTSAQAPFLFRQGDKQLAVHSSPLEQNRRMVLLRETREQDGPQQLESLGLSRREAEVLYWVSEGKSNREMAIILGISSRTIEKHLESIYLKLHVEGRMAAMIAAHGVLSSKER